MPFYQGSGSPAGLSHLFTTHTPSCDDGFGGAGGGCSSSPSLDDLFAGLGGGCADGLGGGYGGGGGCELPGLDTLEFDSMDFASCAPAPPANPEAAFTKEVLRSEGPEWKAFRATRAGRMSRDELARVDAARKRERACVHTAKSKARRAVRTTGAGASATQLMVENQKLRLENVALAQQLAQAQAMLRQLGY